MHSKRSARSVSALFLTLCVALVVAAPARLLPAGPAIGADSPRVHTAFVGVDLLTMTGVPVLSDQTVLIAGDRIFAFGDRDQMPVPPDVHVVDGAGATLMPGLIDMGMYGLDPHDQLPFLVGGATTIHHLRGSLLQLDWDARIAAGTMVGPRIRASSNLIDASTARMNPPWFHADSVDQVAEILDNHVRRGYPTVRIGSTLSPDVYDAILAGAQARGLPVIGDLPFAVGVAGLGPQAAVVGLSAIVAAMHPEDFTLPWGTPGLYFANPTSFLTIDPARVDAVAARVAESGAAIIVSESRHELQILTADQLRERMADPALATIQPIARWGFEQMIDRVAGREAQFPPDLEELAASSEARREVIAALHRNGVPLVAATIGSVMAPDAGLRAGIKAFAAAGMTNAEALHSATVGAARVLGQESEIGRIRSGMRADLLLVEGDPTADLGALDRRRGAMVSGHWHDQADLEAALAARVDYYAAEDRYMGLLEAEGVEAARQWYLDNRTDAEPHPFRHSRTIMYVYQLTGNDDLAKAEAVMRFLTEAYPDSWYVYNTLAYVHTQAGDTEAAIAAYERSLEILPGNFSAVEGIANLREN